MSFSHSDGGHDGEDFDEEFLIKRMQKKFEVRVHKLEATISMHVAEKDTLSEEIVMWKKRHLDADE